VIGRKLGPYEVLAKLGEGGMGEVYTARDQHLERDVAIKVLPEAFTHDHDRIDRFRREAQLLAALNHPNIATIHGLEQAGSVLYSRDGTRAGSDAGRTSSRQLQGRFDEAVEEVTLGLELDPLALYMNAAVVMTCYFTRRFDDAIAHGRSAIVLDPDFFPLHFYLGLAYQQAGLRSEAVASFQRANTLSRESTLTMAGLGAAMAADGHADEARAILRTLEQLASRGRYVSGVWEAAIHAALGDADAALAGLERARNDRCCWLLRCVRLDPRFDVLRNFPRFNALLQRDV
jgi:tetratricopeptide (TPR) repeat protein